MKFNSNSSKTLWDILLKNTDVKLLVAQEQMPLRCVPTVNIYSKFQVNPVCSYMCWYFSLDRSDVTSGPYQQLTVLYDAALCDPLRSVVCEWCQHQIRDIKNVQKILHFHWAAPPVPVDGEEDVACIIDRISSHRRPTITLPEMSSQALWYKKATRVTWVPQNAYSFFRKHTERTCVHEGAGEEMDAEH